MGVIMKNGIAYGSSGGGGTATDTSHIELTYAEYQELEKNGLVDLNATYFITDEDMNGISSAHSIVYDNSNSSILATDVQGAIDELQSRLSSVLNVTVQDDMIYFSDSLARYIEDEEMITFDKE